MDGCNAHEQCPDGRCPDGQRDQMFNPEIWAGGLQLFRSPFQDRPRPARPAIAHQHDSRRGGMGGTPRGAPVMTPANELTENLARTGPARTAQRPTAAN